MTQRNEAAERLRHTIGEKIGLALPLWEPDLDAALAAERRATVKRIRARLLDVPNAPAWGEDVSAILDQEANR